MSKISRKETVALVAVIVVFVCTLGWTLLRMGSSNASGLTLRDTFAQPPGGPLPGAPSGSASNAASGPVSSSPSSFTSSVPLHTTAQPPGQVPSSTEEGAASGGNASSPSIAGGAATGTPPLITALPASDLVVHVAGAVKKPGVYHLPLGARNDDAIQKAGGATTEANTDAINLAAHVEDGSQLFLPTRKQHPEGGAEAATSGAVTAATTPTRSAKTTGRGHPRTPSSGSGGSKGGRSSKFTDPGQGTVNLNTASVEELQRIPGIGPSMAERIAAFRKEGGKFQAPEDLLQIQGIGEKKFAKMQPFVRVK